MTEHIISFDANGDMAFIYSDALVGLLDEGAATVERASNVEPVTTPEGPRWTADLSPVGGPCLAPTLTRQESLDAEVRWLQENVL